MVEFRDYHGLQVQQNHRFQTWEWTLQRVGWIVMALAVLLSLAGFAGPGPVSHNTTQSPDGSYQITYAKYWRQRKPFTLEVQVKPEAASGGKVRLMLSQDYLDLVDIERITPEPSKSELQDSWQTYEFDAAAGKEPVTISFHLEPQSYGVGSGQVGPEGAQPLEIKHFIFP